MKLTSQIAKHLREVYFGGNWTDSNLQSNLEGISWQQATRQVNSFNTIATLVFHTNYYVNALIKVLQGGPLEASDKFSFDLTPVLSEADWDALKQKSFTDAETLAKLIEQRSDADLNNHFSDGKYGNIFRNLIGNLEHIHYHLGQIALVRKVLLKGAD